MASHAFIPARLRVPVVAGIVLLLGAASCDRGTGGPRLNASWTGSDTGKIGAAPTTVWCPVAARLEVMAARQDVGFGLVLYPLGLPATGDYPAFDPGIDSVRRPGASGAARWFTDQAIIGYQSDSGSVGLTKMGDQLQLTFRFRMRSLDGKDTIRAQGEAKGLIPGRCPTDSVPNPAPKQ